MRGKNRRGNEHRNEATNKKVEGSSGIRMVNDTLPFVCNICV